ncbi:hypothetical protein SAY87_020372 [Trapa incisa]|uniref:POX domain-containing protein n=1 Tax=Trapa incisa TaxID=236973 RepID=A0AAN7K3E0_9MYRT|nr:hypothetical protein SAY87_020372 [Trapa incisa]
MGIATARPIFFHHSSNKLPLVTPRDPSDHPLPALKSMSQNYSPSFFNIRDSSFEPSNDEGLQHDQFQRAAQQIRCDKMRLRGFEPMVEIHQEEGEEGMLSEMFNFPVSGSGCSGGGTVELLLDHSAVPFPSLLPPPRPLPPPPNQFTFGGGGYNSEIGCSFIQSQGLSLSLSSSLQHLEAARASDGLLLFNGQGANISPVASFIPQNSHKPWFEIQRQDHRPAHVGYGSQLLVVNVLRTSKYFKAAKELLEEFCSVGRGHLKKAEIRRSTNPSPQCLSSSSGKNNHSGDAGGGGVSSSSSSRCRENPPLSAADRMEHQRRKVRLLSMLDEACNLSPFLPSFS